MKRKSLIILLVAGLLGSLPQSYSQEISHVDPLACPIIGVNFGVMAPSAALSKAVTPEGLRVGGTMADMYLPPYLNFGVDFAYKYKNNWLLTLDGNIFFGSDNLDHRVERMSDLYTLDSIIPGTNGMDAVVTCYNRGFSLKAGVGKIFNFNDKNPNSGLLAKVSGGWMMNQTVFMINEVNAPQIDKPYNRLYDHQRSGFMLTESLGYMFMSNHRTLVNMYVAFEVSQSWTRSTRDYIIDDYMGLRGPDKNKYFDLLYSLKVCWMFPLTGKPVYDYYYF